MLYGEDQRVLKVQCGDREVQEMRTVLREGRAIDFLQPEKPIRLWQDRRQGESSTNIFYRHRADMPEWHPIRRFLVDVRDESLMRAILKQATRKAP